MPWSHWREPHWGQGCRVVWSTENRYGVAADASGVIGNDAPLGPSGASVFLSGMRRCLVGWPRSTARVHPHAIPAWRPAWDGLAADRRLVSPNLRALRPAAPPPRLWSAPLGPPCRACARVPSVSRWRGAGATGPPLRPSVPPRDAAHSPPPAPGHRAAAACPPAARAPPRGAPARPARSP